MSPADRLALGKAGWTADESLAKSEARTERAEQKIFSQWLNLNQVYYIQPRPDRKSGIKVGHPDFSIFRAGKALFIEMKAPGGRLSEEQKRCIGELVDQGFSVELAYSAGEAIIKTREFFELKSSKIVPTGVPTDEGEIV
jgi:hypothetical protein